MWPKEADVKEFYGNPDINGDGSPDFRWEADNLVTFPPPYRMVAAWDVNQTIQKIRCHRLVKPSLQGILMRIWLLYGHDQDRIDAARLHLYGGAYNFRLMRGSTRLSMHSYACAIDLDPERNALGKKWNAGMIPMPVVEVFEDAGWTWGGRWKRPDAQHFQAADV